VVGGTCEHNFNNYKKYLLKFLSRKAKTVNSKKLEECSFLGRGRKKWKQKRQNSEFRNTNDIKIL
jgi:hypothetical protein